MRFLTQRFLDKAGGIEPLRALCEANGVPPPNNVTFRMWKSRGTIPKGWAIALMLLLRENDHTPIHPESYADELPVDPFS